MTTPSQPPGFANGSESYGIDQLCDAFERLWLAGNRQPLETYLATVATGLRKRAFHNLLLVEIELRGRDDEPPSVEEYLRRFPDEATLIHQVFRNLADDRSTVLIADADAEGSCPSSGSLRETASPMSEDLSEPLQLPGYTQLREVGRGAMGRVYAAIQEPLGRTVAIKTIWAGTFASQEDVERFRAEAESAAKLDHPNIVPIHEVGRHGDLHYFTMCFVEGDTLKDRIAERGLTGSESAQLVATLAETVEYAHGKGIVHRDLKPANVLIDLAGRPKITDFGLAKRIESDSELTATGQVLGTPSYMPPEQAVGDGGRIGPHSDVYALGAILYACLTGRPPFQGTNVVETLKQVTGREPVPPRQLEPTIDRDLETICLKCLEKEPAKRYATAAELALDLRRFVGGHPIMARPVGRLSRSWRWCRRNRSVAILGASVLLLMALGITVAGTLAIQQNRVATTLQSVLAQAQRDHALSIWDRARQLCEEGRIGYGLLILAKALEAVPEGPEDANLRDAIKTDLAGWHRHCHTLQNVFVHPDRVLALACSPDGALAVTGCADGFIRAWALETGEVRWTSLAHHGGVTALAFAGSQDLLSGGSDGQVLIWEAASGKPMGMLEGHENGIQCIAASPDGQWVLVGGADHETRLWDQATRTCLERWLHPGRVMTVGFSPDGRLFFMGGEGASGGPGEFHLHKTDSRQRVPIDFRHQPAMTVRSAAISNFRGETLILGDDNWETMFFDLSSGRRMLTTDYGRGRVSAVAVAPRGATVLVGAEDSQQVMLWDLRAVRRQWTAQQDGGITLAGQGGGIPRPLLPALSHPRAVTATAFVPPAGRQFLTACEDGCVRLWRQAPGPSIRVLEHAPKSPLHRNREHVVRATAIHPSLPLGATAGEDGRVLLWDLRTAERHGSPLQVNTPLRSVEFTPDGRAVVTCGKDGRVRVWDLQTRELIPQPELPITGASSISIGVSRNEILVGRMSGAERWDLDTGIRVGPVFQHGMENVELNLETVISPNHERFLTTAEDGTARLWDPSGRMLAVLDHQNTARGGGFSPDNNLMVTASDDRTARVWDADTGASRMSLTHDHEVLTAVFSDNHRVITGSRVGAQLWDVPLQRRLGPRCQFQHAVVDVSCTSDGRTALLADWDGYGIVWSIPEPIPGDAETIMLWVQMEVGIKLDDADGHEVLSGTAWLECRDRLLAAPSDFLAAQKTLPVSP